MCMYKSKSMSFAHAYMHSFYDSIELLSFYWKKKESQVECSITQLHCEQQQIQRFMAVLHAMSYSMHGHIKTNSYQLCFFFMHCNQVNFAVSLFFLQPHNFNCDCVCTANFKDVNLFYCCERLCVCDFNRVILSTFWNSCFFSLARAIKVVLLKRRENEIRA